MQLRLPDSLQHTAKGWRPVYPPPNPVHNNRFLPPRLLHTVHIQIHTRRAASRGGPGPTTPQTAGGSHSGPSCLLPLLCSFSLLSLSIRLHLLGKSELGDLGSPEVPFRSHIPSAGVALSPLRRLAVGPAPVLAGAEREPRGSSAATAAAAAARLLFGDVETPLRQLVAQVACVDAGRGGRPATAASAPAAPAGERAAGTRPAPPLRWPHSCL